MPILVLTSTVDAIHLIRVGSSVPMLLWVVMKTVSALVTGKVCLAHIVIGSQASSLVPTGNLCGSCREGKGVSVLLNKCVSCTDTSTLLILALGTYNYILLASTVTQSDVGNKITSYTHMALT